MMEEMREDDGQERKRERSAIRGSWVLIKRRAGDCGTLSMRAVASGNSPAGSLLACEDRRSNESLGVGDPPLAQCGMTKGGVANGAGGPLGPLGRAETIRGGRPAITQPGSLPKGPAISHSDG